MFIDKNAPPAEEKGEKPSKKKRKNPISRFSGVFWHSIKTAKIKKKYSLLKKRKLKEKVVTKSEAPKPHQYEKSSENIPKDYLEPILSKNGKQKFLFLVAIWLVSLALFFSFWFKTEHVVGLERFAINTLLLLWSMVLPGYFYYFIYQMKRVNPKIEIPAYWRVAMVVTRAPSEPFELVKKTLRAMLNQHFPHDTWLADEDPSPEIKKWCELHGVKLCTRKNIKEYHRTTWPRRTKCKEGNLAYFYDKHGYDNYDFVVQLDADHIPGDGYLTEMLRPFVHPEVGYVSAPSVCDTNASTSWAARGRLYAESIMHGVLQAGYSFFYAPLCIGSHYAVRTEALKQIGGLGPELAEDHSTTLMFQGNGWRGVHAFDAVANGEGPQTLRDCITQEFQWSRSLIIILFTLMPKYWKKLPLKLKVQFVFSQLWYPIFSFSMLIGFLLPVVAVFTGVPWVSVSFVEFLKFSIPLTLSIVAVSWFLKEQGLLKPAYSPVISYETVVFQIVRWPWALYGTIMGVITGIWGRSPSFKVTPKGNEVKDVMDWNIIFPYLVIVFLCFVPVFALPEKSNADGYFFFLILNTVIYIAILFVMIVLHRKEALKANEALRNSENLFINSNTELSINLILI